MEYKIRRSTYYDIPALLNLADKARKIMRANGNTRQWINGYPSEAVFTDDINKNNSYIIEDDNGIAVASFTFIKGPEPTYAIIEKGNWIEDDSDYYVIHRIASRPEYHNIFQVIMRFCFSKTSNIRIDTHRDNTIMQHLLKKHGFGYCGIIYLNNGDERLAFQKVIAENAMASFT